MSVADELSKLAALKDKGLLTAAEFEAQKAKLLAGAQQTAPPTEPTVNEEKKGSPVFITLLVVAGIVFAVFVFGASVADSPETRALTADKKAIDLCWEDQRRKSLTPDAQRFIAGTCEMMEADFINRWGRKP